MIVFILFICCLILIAITTHTWLILGELKKISANVYSTLQMVRDNDAKMATWYEQQMGERGEFQELRNNYANYMDALSQGFADQSVQFKAGFASKKTLLKLDEIERKIEAQAAAIEELKPVEKQVTTPKAQPVKPRTFSEFKAELGNDATRF